MDRKVRDHYKTMRTADLIYNSIVIVGIVCGIIWAIDKL